jgi:hypothetical protein
MQLSDMAQLLGAKELHSFITYLLRSYDYADYTQVDRSFFYLIQDVLSHPKLMLKLK